MIIIFGTRSQEQVIRQGNFYCPSCDAERRYSLIEVSSYFTLFFAPIFKTSSGSRFVKCQSCQKTFSDNVFDAAPPNPTERIARQFFQKANSGIPISIVKQTLINSGIDPEELQAAIAGTFNKSDIKSCVKCNLHYLDSVDNCSNCGSELYYCNK